MTRKAIGWHSDLVHESGSNRISGQAPRLLVLMRHGKAEAGGPTDFERQLTSRGRRDAAEAGRSLAAIGIKPDGALVSAAERTRQTWEELAAGAGWAAEATYSQRLYTADADEIVAEVRWIDTAVQTLVVVGHNPTISYLAADLAAGNSADPAVELAMQHGFATSARAVLEFDGDWPDLGYGTCRVVAFSAPGEMA